MFVSERDQATTEILPRVGVATGFSSFFVFDSGVRRFYPAKPEQNVWGMALPGVWRHQLELEVIELDETFQTLKNRVLNVGGVIQRE
jgi:hypothetical protein